MVRTTIVLPEEDFRELRALAAARDRSISWRLREAFRLSKSSLQGPEPFAQSFDRVWTPTSWCRASWAPAPHGRS